MKTQNQMTMKTQNQMTMKTQNTDHKKDKETGLQVSLAPFRALLTGTALLTATLFGTFAGSRCEASVVVTAGLIEGINGTTLFEALPPPDRTININSTSDGTPWYVLLDLGSVQDVDAIINVNRFSTSTTLNAYTALVFVAADEAELFDLSDPSSYSLQVFSGELDPVSSTAGEARTMNITNVSRQYFLIEYTANLASSGTVLQIGDIQVVTAVPEPGTVTMLGIGAMAGLVFFRRRSLRSSAV